MYAGAVLVLAVLVLFFIVRPDGSKKEESTNPTSPVRSTGATGGEAASEKPARPEPPPPPEVTIENGEPRDGVARLEFVQGDRIRFTVVSDVADEVHVHGYDVSREVGPSRTAKFSFPADITGVFEVELEHSAVPIAELQVNP